MLLPEQVVPFLRHDDPIVRNHALRYFRNGYDFGPLTAENYWAVIDRLGENDQTLSFASNFDDVPQTDASFSRLLRAFSSKSEELFEFHYLHCARNMDLAILARRRDELLAVPQLTTHIREHLQLRLDLLDRPPIDAWDRLMEHGRELGIEYKGRFSEGLSDALIEAAARGGDAVCRQALITLDDEAAQRDWREIFAVKVLGAARYEPAIDALIQKYSIDADVLREETTRALSRIGTREVVDKLAAFYPGKPWHVRLYARSPASHIKRPESVDALLKMLDVELALEKHPDENDDEGEPLVDNVLIDLANLCSLSGLDESRRLIEKYPDDAEAMDLCESLIAVAAMNGVILPEEAAWRRLVKKHEDRYAARRGRLSLDSSFSAFRSNWMKTGMLEPPGADKDAALGQTRAPAPVFEPDPDRLEPIRKTAPKIGRNEPCPCGSGKKYKKCCGK